MNFVKILGRIFLFKIKFPAIEHTPEGFDVLPGGNERIHTLYERGLKDTGVITIEALRKHEIVMGAIPVPVVTDEEIEAYTQNRVISIDE